jgi:hypothetical protein
MISINITDPTETTFTVLDKNTNVRKMITMAKNSSLWKLR